MWSLHPWHSHSSHAAKLCDRGPDRSTTSQIFRRKEQRGLIHSKRIQDNRVEELAPFTEEQVQKLKGRAAPEQHDWDEPEAHVDMPYGSQKSSAKAATVFFFRSD